VIPTYTRVVPDQNSAYALREKILHTVFKREIRMIKWAAYAQKVIDSSI
jgi:hypothetical protein